MFIPVNTLTLITVVAISCRFVWFYWVYIPAMVDYIKNPVLRNMDVQWRQPLPTAPTAFKKPNIILILTDDMVVMTLNGYWGFMLLFDTFFAGLQ